SRLRPGPILVYGVASRVVLPAADRWLSACQRSTGRRSGRLGCRHVAANSASAGLWRSDGELEGSCSSELTRAEFPPPHRSARVDRVEPFPTFSPIRQSLDERRLWHSHAVIESQTKCLI